jgi:hypothetical protein
MGVSGVIHIREYFNFGITSCAGVAEMPNFQDMNKLTQMIDALSIRSLVLGEGL